MATKTPRNLLEARARSERDTARRNIGSELARLIDGCTRARAALKRGDQLDPHLIANASMMTHDIARWNLITDLLPYIEENSKDK